MKYYFTFLLLLTLPFSALCQLKTISGRSISTAEFERQIRKKMDSLNVKGMSVALIQKGKLIYKNGFGYADVEKKKLVDQNTMFEAASLSKSVFASYVLSLANQGLIDLEQPLYTYLPNQDISDDRYQLINARMVLSHTTGLPNWRESEKMTLAFDPGTRFSYSGEAYMYLAKVVAHLQKISLKELDQKFQQNFARSWKLKNFNFVMTGAIEKELAVGYQGNSMVKDDRDRSFFDPAGGLYANGNTFGTFLVKLLKERSKFKELFDPKVALKQDDPIRQFFGIQAWTLGLAVIPFENTAAYWHGGNNLGFTSSFMIDPDKQFGYVFFTNADQCNGMKKVFEEILWH